uniref:Putative mediator of RNA polymerase II transcription subunit 26 isoform X5 n=1 Tax=Rhizophora mucronata TaxID=61149 RepID=A0A2P2KM16_RHIMU
MSKKLNLTPYQLDIDELINEFAEDGLTTLADFKKTWVSRKFSYIYDASPSTNLAFFMQSLYAHTMGELKKLRHLVVEAKEHSIKVVPTLVKRMLEKNVFLFGFVDLNEDSVGDTVNHLSELYNSGVKLAWERVVANPQIEKFLLMDMGMEFDLSSLKKMSSEYAEAKKEAIQEASKVVDVQNIRHISMDGELIGDVMEKITDKWNSEKEVLCQQTGLNGRRVQAEHQKGHHQKLELLEQQDDDYEFSHQLELQLCEEPQEQKEEDEEFSYAVERQLFGKH